jgi:alkaline phosphatase D
MREQKPSNPIVITGDAHVHSVRNVPPTFESFDGTPVAVEFIGTSISTDGDPTTAELGRPHFGDDTENPHRLFQCDRRGYVTVDVTPETWQADFRSVTVAAPASAGETVASFAVEDGVPGATQVFPPPTTA